MNDDALQHTPFDGVGDYVAALDTVCAAASHSLIVFENNFEDIGFNSESRYDTLRSFLLASSTNRLRLLAHDPQHLVRFCPRMMMLLRQFSHSMEIFQTPEHLRHITEAFTVADGGHFVRRFHFDHARGLLAKNDPSGALELKSRFEEMWGSSHPCASPTTLGL